MKKFILLILFTLLLFMPLFSSSLNVKYNQVVKGFIPKFTFSSTGDQRYLGTAEGVNSALEIYGPKTNISKVFYWMIFSKDLEENKIVFILSQLLIQNIFPGYDSLVESVMSKMNFMLKNLIDKEEISFKGKIITLELDRVFGGIQMTIEGD